MMARRIFHKIQKRGNASLEFSEATAMYVLENVQDSTDIGTEEVLRLYSG